MYEIVQLRSGDDVALPLTLSLIVGVVGLTLRGVRLLGREGGSEGGTYYPEGSLFSDCEGAYLHELIETATNRSAKVASLT